MTQGLTQGVKELQIRITLYDSRFDSGFMLDLKYLFLYLQCHN